MDGNQNAKFDKKSSRKERRDETDERLDERTHAYNGIDPGCSSASERAMLLLKVW